MIKKKIALYLASLITLLSSCRNDVEYSLIAPGAPTGPDSNWSQVLPNNAGILALRNELRLNKKSLQYYFTGNMDISLPGTGLRIELDGPLRTSPGSAPVTGNIEIQWELVQLKGQMIRYLTAANSGEIENAPLLIYINFKKNGLDLKPDSNSLEIEYSAGGTYPADLELYHADEASPEPAQWTPASGRVFFDRFSGRIQIHTNQTGWLMTASTAEFPSRHRFTVIPRLPSFYTNVNSQAFLVASSNNIVYQLNSDVLNSRFYISQLKDEFYGKLVIVSKMGDSYYLGKQAVGINNNQSMDTISVNITPTITTLANIIYELNNL